MSAILRPLNDETVASTVRRSASAGIRPLEFRFPEAPGLDGLPRPPGRVPSSSQRLPGLRQRTRNLRHRHLAVCDYFSTRPASLDA